MGRSEVFFKEVRGALLMVAALIATVTFSAGIYPPGGFWQDDLQGKHMAGKPIMADKDKSKYDKFMNRNTHAFIQSLLFIMLLLVSYAMPHHTLLVALVFCVGVSLLTTLVFLGLAYSTGSSGLLTESASTDMLHYALIYLAALIIVIFVTWIITCSGRLAKRLTIGESHAAAAEGVAYSMEDGTGRGP